jgi:hypothetical protein
MVTVVLARAGTTAIAGTLASAVTMAKAGTPTTVGSSTIAVTSEKDETPVQEGMFPIRGTSATARILGTPGTPTPTRNRHRRVDSRRRDNRNITYSNIIRNTRNTRDVKTAGTLTTAGMPQCKERQQRWKHQ